LLEANPVDAELALARLENAGIEHRATRVQTRADFLTALEASRPDLILADVVVPDYDGLSALDLAQVRCPEVPFIFVSNALGEERAVDSLLRGATDYVLKQRPERLVPAVRRALKGASAHVEPAVRDSEDRVRLALSVGRMGTWDLDVVTGAIRWSAEAPSVLRGPGERLPDDLDGLIGLASAEDGERLRASIDGAIADVSEQVIEFRLPRADGMAWIRMAGRVLADKVGRPVRVVGIAADFTDQRRGEEHLRQVQRMEALGRLAGGMAHETNNQMAVVIGFADFILRRGDLAADLRGDLVQIRRAAERTAAVTQQLLTFSRRQVVQPEVLNVSAVAAAFAPVLRRTLGEQSTLETRLTGSYHVRIGRGQIEQVLLNLALNAVDAMPSGGTLMIETSELELPAADRGPRQEFPIREGCYALLAVSDTGTGMDRSTVERIFEPFFTTKEIGKGSGLGLAAVYGIVKQADGYVWARSELGQGTTIEVYLPLLPAPDDQRADEDGVPVKGDETVLLVEDEPHMREIAARALQAEGYRVYQASNGKEALAVLADHDGVIQLVVSDIAMPVVNGRTLRTQISDQRGDLPVLLISGYSRDDLRRRGLVDDDDQFLQKPFAPADLARKVREVLDRTEEGKAGAAPDGSDAG
jgi:two-component system, cell cycle sensor histidine kinase and response regulator CckA